MRIKGKGVKHSIGENGVMTVLDGGELKKVALLEDYRAAKNTGESDYKTASDLIRSSFNRIASIKGRKRFSNWVCLDGAISPEISDENGIFTVLVSGRLRQVQFANQYQIQHGLSCKNTVFAMCRAGVKGLELGVLPRLSSNQHINIVVLPEN